MTLNPYAIGIDQVVTAELKDIAMRRLAREIAAVEEAEAGAKSDSENLGVTEAPRDTAVEAEAAPKTWMEKCIDQQLLAIAISGGGIRSATFALGVLQGLVEKGLLQKADYLSTVSGGGYIGSWLQGLLYRGNDFRTLDPRRIPGPPATDPITFLRKYSNYLAPRIGFTLDTLMIPVIWLRNTILNQAIIISSFVAVVMLVFWPGFLIQLQARKGTVAFSVLALLLALLAVFVATVFVGRDLWKIVRRMYEDDSGGQLPTPPAGIVPSKVAWLVILPLMSAVTLFLFAVVPADAFLDYRLERAGSFFILWLLHLLLQWQGGFVLYYGDLRHSSKSAMAWFHTIWMSLASAGFLWGLLLTVNRLVEHWHPRTIEGAQMTIAWAPPLFLVAVMAGVSLQIGLMGADFPDASREWLARVGAFLVIAGVVWATVFTVATFSPLWVTQLWVASHTLLTSGTAAWVLTTISSVMAGKSAKTGNPAEGNIGGMAAVLDIVARYGPFVAIAGFLILIAFGAHVLLYLPVASPEDSFLAGFQNSYWQVLEFHDAALAIWSWMIFFAAVIVAVTLSLRVNINEFSLNHFYRNRLVRCYLGASNTQQRAPDAFTGFDPLDDIQLSKLQWNAENRPVGPYPIVNTTLNVTAGAELATQQRKALSFVFTPHYSGFVPAFSDADRITGEVDPDETPSFVPSEEILGGVRLGAAMAISGAAASPNMGYHSSPQTAFLLTLFNVRLGWWAGNPRDAGTYDRSGPRFALHWLVRELLGDTNSRSAYMSLSDGGHFENLGLYELVRRRVKYIISIDAEEDAGYCFEGLGSAVRKCRADFGVEIEIDPRPIRLKDGLSPVHCVMGRIHYPETSEPGWLMYLKSSLTGDEPADVQEYHCDAAEFPQQSTANQFFSESQFESYRRLGLHVAEQAFEKVNSKMPLKKCFAELAVNWEPRAK